MPNLWIAVPIVKSADALALEMGNSPDVIFSPLPKAYGQTGGK
jgi:hypothetical protein